MKTKLKGIGLVSLVVLTTGLLMVPSVSGWWWTANPPAFSHQTVPPQDRDGEARGEIDDKNGAEFAFQFFTGGPNGNPEQIQDVANQVCVWSIYYELEAKVSQNPPQGFGSNIIEIHGYLDFLDQSGWTQVATDWMAAQEDTPGDSEQQSGCLHLYYSGHNYGPNEDYRVRLNFTSAWYDDSTPPVRTVSTNTLLEAYYRII